MGGIMVDGASRLIGMFLLLTLLGIGQAIADDTASQTRTLKDEAFIVLLQKRDQVLTSIVDKQNLISSDSNSLGWYSTEKSKKQELNEAINKHERPEKIKQLQIELESAHGNVGAKSESDLKLEMDGYGRDITELKKQQSAIEFEMNLRADIENPKQSFRTTMSVTFGLLVGLVIIGFYVLAYRDEKVRSEVFSRQTGIQFITLFSLVIAIILFGITGILESKELSALLGGLSGYILGRTSEASASRQGA
jgi:hypothetical protein